MKKPSRNVSEITWKNHASKNRKMSPKELPAAPPRHLKIVQKRTPNSTWAPVAPQSGPRCPGAHILRPRPHILSISATILRRFWKEFATPKAANQASAEAENFSAMLHISSRLRALNSFFYGSAAVLRTSIYIYTYIGPWSIVPLLLPYHLTLMLHYRFTFIF